MVIMPTFHARSLVLSIAAIALSLELCAQETVGGIPLGLLNGWDRHDIPTVIAAPFDAAAVALDDTERDREGALPLYGRFQAVHADPLMTGQWTELGNGDRVWRQRVLSPGALAMELFFADHHMPPGSILHVYDEAGGQLQGGYTAYNTQPDGSFSTDMVYGDACIIEYYEPGDVRGQGGFRLTQVAHAYRMVGGERADPCQVDVNCSEGAAWTNQRDAVVRIRVVIPQGVGFCTGVLMNNTGQNCDPLVLSAFHCSQGSSAAQFNQYQFRFNYQRLNCGTGDPQAGNTVTGCTRLADSNDNGGDNGSDFVLVRLNNPLPANINAFYAGWDATGMGSGSGVSIHHPAGDEKKVSTYTANLVSSSWWLATGSHWRVSWAATANGHGVTEGGSSGSPIFNAAKRVLGTLTGGASCCTLNGCGQGTSPTAPDYYGKMSYHWSQNPNPASEKLRLFLSPGGNVTTFDGAYCTNVSVQDWDRPSPPEVFPNPAVDRVTVRPPHPLRRIDRVEVTDITGRLVHAERPVTSGDIILDVSAWGAGSYRITLIADGVRLPGAKVLVAGR